MKRWGPLAVIVVVMVWAIAGGFSNVLELIGRGSREGARKNPTPVEYVTIDGYDPATGDIIQTINMWKEHDTGTLAGTVRHGEKIRYYRGRGQRVEIQTSRGTRGWVSYMFIKEMK